MVHVDRYARAIFPSRVSKGCLFIHVQSSLTIVVGEGILLYLPTLMEKLLLALSPSTVSRIFKDRQTDNLYLSTMVIKAMQLMGFVHKY